jgi:hypothetical protein
MPIEYAGHGNSAGRVTRLILHRDRVNHARALESGPQVEFHLMTMSKLEYFALYIHNANSNTEEYDSESVLI